MAKLQNNKNRLAFYKVDTSTNTIIPYAEQGIKAGFPSPAQDYLIESLDLNKIVIKNPAFTFFAKVNGDSMKDERIYDGDITVVDKSLDPIHNDKVVCYIDGEFNVKFIEIDKKNKLVWLVSANPEYPKMKVTTDSDFLIWGVVTYTFIKHRK